MSGGAIEASDCCAERIVVKDEKTIIQKKNLGFLLTTRQTIEYNKV